MPFAKGYSEWLSRKCMLSVVMLVATAMPRTSSLSSRIRSGPEEPAANTPTTSRATDKDGLVPVFRVTNTVDIYVSHASAPNAGVSPRHVLLAANAPHDLYVKPGDKLAWVQA